MKKAFPDDDQAAGLRCFITKLIYSQKFHVELRQTGIVQTMLGI